jgi:hypothetical protein
MGFIKKVKNCWLVGGTDNTDVYPVTSTKAVYDENNVSQDYLNKHITGDRIESNTIPGDKLANKALTEEKVSDALMDKINASAHGVTEEFETYVRESLTELREDIQNMGNITFVEIPQQQQELS